VRGPVAAALVATALALAGCGGEAGGAAEEPRLTVLAAASLTDVLPRIDDRPRYSFGGSNALARQLREGAPADLVASADPRHTRELHRRGLVEEPVVFARNTLVLVVPAANPAGIERVEDLDRDRVRLVVAGEQVPAGAYTRELLGALGLDGVLERAVSREPDVKGVVGKVALGEADAGFVYATDARAAAGRVRALELPAAAQPPIAYELAVVAAGGQRERARAFVERVLGEEGRAALAEAGFRLP
jgi:molybdate transport system substrate-binding protein